MGSTRLTLCTAVLAVAAFAPAAQAADGGSVSVTPSTPAAGADLTLRVTGCAGKTATAASAAFVADARLTGSGGSLAGETRVRSSIEPGSYDVKITCADFQVKGRITVVAAKGDHATAPATPAAPVNAGGGWTATHLSGMEPHATGPGTGHAVTGLVLAGVAAVAVVLRRSRRSRGTD
ncbi:MULTISPECIES: hypothetical protein [unclassified Streptomyces]|jgi:hypothetical protein|uniref:hypothetical protein n=1 Tax=unclassified Streptomyces TaxID=2593676 RepID=UPI000F5076B0|nr:MULTISPECIES: hypothetical protein [unclassified Streptomyces]MDH6450447.1 hypothetical protein [Streptomyces sp. SAI-119]MDH6499009.1 hypothetical protein [Streptomyces sp. SAI-149]GLP65563.1 hypothetical protein TUSST3_21830 [Streptomyces sp. TUS-ST3]